jgi:hypothetical protein
LLFFAGSLPLSRRVVPRGRIGDEEVVVRRRTIDA